MYNGPHGAVVAAVLPSAIEINVRALRAREDTVLGVPGEALQRFTETARIVTGNADAKAEDAAVSA
jgi:hypothetical protein